MSIESINLNLKSPFLSINRDHSGFFSDKFRIYINLSIQYNNEIYSNNLWIINVKGKLEISKEDGYKYYIELSPDSQQVFNFHSVYFSNFVTKSQIDLLDKWRHGEDLNAKFTIDGLVFSNSDTNARICSINGNVTFKVTNNDFAKNILDPCGLLSYYYREFEDEFANVTLNNELDEFFDCIRGFHSCLSYALKQFKKAQNSEEYGRSLGQIRVMLDTIKNYRTNQTIISYLENMLEFTKTITITPSSITNQNTTNKTPQNELVNNFFDLFDIIFNFTSKSQHTLSKNKQTSFKMNADIEDVEYILTLAYSITSYLSKKLLKCSKP